MRNAYLVCYDVCDDKRLQKIYKTMRGWGDHLQLSVFQCELSYRKSGPKWSSPSCPSSIRTKISADR